MIGSTGSGECLKVKGWPGFQTHVTWHQNREKEHRTSAPHWEGHLLGGRTGKSPQNIIPKLAEMQSSLRNEGLRPVFKWVKWHVWFVVWTQRILVIGIIKQTPVKTGLFIHMSRRLNFRKQATNIRKHQDVTPMTLIQRFDFEFESLDQVRSQSHGSGMSPDEPRPPTVAHPS